MAIATIQASADIDDTYGKISAPTSNFGGATNWWVGERNDQANSTQRGLLKFDLSGIPSGSTVNSATLTLRLIFDASSNTRTYRVFRVLRAWVEAEATWNIYSTGNNWGTAMCANTSTDREATNIGSVSFTSTESIPSTKDFTLTASDIEEMLDGGIFTNNGFLIKADTESDDSYRFDSSDNGTEAQNPKLVIDYTAPVVSRRIFLIT